VKQGGKFKMLEVATMLSLNNMLSVDGSSLLNLLPKMLGI